MASSFHRDSAQIYDFAARRAQRLRGRAAETAAQQPPRTECGGGWYHEAAMREEAEARAARFETKPA